MQAYQNFVFNAYLWLLLGILFRLPSLLAHDEACQQVRSSPWHRRPRIAVVSPFLDRQHGTERCVVEQVERLARDYEVHVYSNRVKDIDPDAIVFHLVPALSGPHLLAYCWWFLANHLWRWWDQRVRGLRFDLIYTPGINCVDADVISVHALFSELFRQVSGSLSLRQNPVSSWARVLHRRMYYRLIRTLEPLIYTRRSCVLAAVSQKAAGSLAIYRRDRVPVIYHGVDCERFNPSKRRQLRKQARASLQLADSMVCLLLVGNDWKNKGLITLLDAVGSIRSPRPGLIVVGHDDPGPYRTAIERWGLSQSVQFLPPRPDIEFYYAAADIYVSPVLEDAFGLPPLEAMACALPVIVSSRAGVSELVSDGVDGMVLKDPRNSASLAKLISQLQSDFKLRQTLADNAARTASQYTWERNAAQLGIIFEQAMQLRGGHQTSTMQEVL